MLDLKEQYAGKKVLITGGLGFIGSNLAHKLVSLGGEVTILDANLARYGGNYFNISEIKDQVIVEEGDIRDSSVINRHIFGKNVIFNLAAQVDHNYGMQNPHLDIDINCKGHINVLEECRKNNPNARIVFPGSRMQYGKVSDSDLPVHETHQLRPLSIYAANKAAGELYYMAYNNHHKLDTVSLRVTNPFGPRAQVKHPGYCIVNWFVRQALEGKDITIYGDGAQIRDYIFIDDLVDAFLTAGVHPNAKGRVYNAGSGTPMHFRDMAKQVMGFANGGQVRNVPWPENYENVETGNFYADITRIHSELGWKPETSFEEGLKKTVDFYRENLTRYI